MAVCGTFRAHEDSANRLETCSGGALGSRMKMGVKRFLSCLRPPRRPNEMVAASWALAALFFIPRALQFWLGLYTQPNSKVTSLPCRPQPANLEPGDFSYASSSFQGKTLCLGAMISASRLVWCPSTCRCRRKFSGPHLGTHESLRTGFPSLPLLPFQAFQEDS